MKSHIINRFATLMIFIWAAMQIPALSQGSSDSDYMKNYSEEIFMDMDFEPNIATPAIPESEKEAIKKYIRGVAESITNFATVDLMREDEVFIATIPTDELFMPNDSMLVDNAEARLRPIIDLMKDPFMYKIVLAIHTDNTGSNKYCEYLSTTRMNSIYDLMLEEIDNGVLSEDLIIIPFAMGSSRPIVPNDTRMHRSENRRLEIYFIPGPKLIEMAKQGTLK